MVGGDVVVRGKSKRVRNETVAEKRLRNRDNRGNRYMVFGRWGKKVSKVFEGGESCTSLCIL